VRLACEAASANNDAYRAGLLLDLASIRTDIEGHYWRSERIMEARNARSQKDPSIPF
jgi:hypothetical protein